jgi:hypothetical protein
MTPIDEQLREAWYKFREYVNKEMKHAPSNAQRKLNGAGAFVDFLAVENPERTRSMPTIKRVNGRQVNE